MKCNHNRVYRIKRTLWQRLFFKEVHRCHGCGKLIKI